MKKNKLNAVVASILSFGIVCSGSVFASKVGGNSSKGRTKGQTILCERSSRTAGTAKLKGPKKEEFGYKKYNPMKLKSTTDSKSKEKDFNEIKDRIGYELRYLIRCREDWTDLKPPFNMRRWNELPLTIEEFILKSVKCHDELESIIASLELHAVMNGLKCEGGAFHILRRICDKIYNQYRFVI